MVVLCPKRAAGLALTNMVGWRQGACPACIFLLLSAHTLSQSQPP